LLLSRPRRQMVPRIAPLLLSDRLIRRDKAAAIAVAIYDVCRAARSDQLGAKTPVLGLGYRSRLF
jgi:hypothetical protein